jgi:hypothetical protein
MVGGVQPGAEASILGPENPHSIAGGSESVDTSPVVAGLGGPESVDTSGRMAGFDPRESVDTPSVVAGFGHTPGRPPRPRTATPAAFRYPLAVSRRTPVACSIRLSDQPSRPKASTCCFLSSAKTLLIPAVDHVTHRLVNVSVRYSWWPVFRRP